MKLQYKNILVLDTNIILNDHENIEILSNKSENLIVLPETVLDELDSKKSGFDEINFQSRAFGRLFSKATIQEVKRERGMTLTKVFINSEKQITILVVSKEKYYSDQDTVHYSILNDRKIIEVCSDLSVMYKNVKFITLDNMARYRAISIGLETEVFELSPEKEHKFLSSFETKDIKDYYTLDVIEEFDLPKETQALEVIGKYNKRKYFYKTSGKFMELDEKEIMKQNIKPRNLGQKIFSSMILDEYNNVIISDAPAGSGKTIIALSSAMKLLDTHKDKYEKIIYIRKTVLSDNEELGFLPGTLDEKMNGFLSPLYSNIEFIVEEKYKNRKNKPSREEKEKLISDMIEKYQIEFLYEGHLRGTNIRNAIVIVDELQNNSVGSARTIISRIGENCKLIGVGSTKQIDSKYLNKHNNALTYLKNKIGEENMGVHVSGITLEKTVRSKIAEWADNFK